MIKAGVELGLRLRRSYLLDFILELVYLPVEFLVFYYVYGVIYEGYTVVSGYTLDQLVVYLFASFLLRRVYPIGVRSRIERDIHDGLLTAYLVRPIGYARFLYGLYLSSFLSIFPLLLLILLAFQVIVHGTGPSLLSIAFFAAASLIGFTVTFELYAITGLASLWLGRHHWLGNLLTLSTLVLGGGYIPVAFFPDIIEKLLVYSPLQAVYNFPASSIATGAVDAAFLTSSLAWTLILLGLLSHMITKGLRRYEAVGG